MQVNNPGTGMTEWWDDTTHQCTHLAQNGQWVPINQFAGYPVGPNPWQSQATTTPPPAAAAQADTVKKTWGSFDQSEVERERARMAAQRAGGFPRYEIQIADQEVYILPPPVGAPGFLTLSQHFGNLTERNYPVQCLTKINLPCPICKYAEALQDAGHVQAAKDLTAKTSHAWLILPVAKMQEGFKVLQASPTLHADILDCMSKCVNLADPEQGRPIIITKTKQGQRITYKAGITAEPRPLLMVLRQAGLMHILEELPNLRKLEEYKSQEELTELLKEALAANPPRLPYVQGYRVGSAPAAASAPAPAQNQGWGGGTQSAPQGQPQWGGGQPAAAAPGSAPAPAAAPGSQWGQGPIAAPVTGPNSAPSGAPGNYGQSAVNNLRNTVGGIPAAPGEMPGDPETEDKPF